LISHTLKGDHGKEEEKVKMTKEKKYIEDYINLNMSDDDIEIWKKGCGEELKKLLGIGMFDLKFERDGTKVTISYEKEEGNKVHEAIYKFLEKEGNFDKLADDFWGSIYKKREIQEKMMPFLIIADEIDNHPEIASADDKRRLMRVRTATHEESYK